MTTKSGQAWRGGDTQEMDSSVGKVLPEGFEAKPQPLPSPFHPNTCESQASDPDCVHSRAYVVEDETGGLLGREGRTNRAERDWKSQEPGDS